MPDHGEGRNRHQQGEHNIQRTFQGLFGDHFKEGVWGEDPEAVIVAVLGLAAWISIYQLVDQEIFCKSCGKSQFFNSLNLPFEHTPSCAPAAKSLMRSYPWIFLLSLIDRPSGTEMAQSDSVLSCGGQGCEETPYQAAERPSLDTGLFVRAQVEGEWRSVDVAALERESLIRYFEKHPDYPKYLLLKLFGLELTSHAECECATHLTRSVPVGSQVELGTLKKCPKCGVEYILEIYSGGTVWEPFLRHGGDSC